MKKCMILLALCLTMCAVAMAQNRPQRGGNNHQMMQAGQHMPAPNADAVVDTTIINHIGLSDDVLAKVYNLQQAKKESLGAMMREMRPERGTRMTEEQSKAFTEKRSEFVTNYRKELRELIGDEAYINYLEKQLDSRSLSQGMRRGGNQRGGQRPDEMHGGHRRMGGIQPEGNDF